MISCPRTKNPSTHDHVDQAARHTAVLMCRGECQGNAATSWLNLPRRLAWLLGFRASFSLCTPIAKRM